MRDTGIGKSEMGNAKWETRTPPSRQGGSRHRRGEGIPFPVSHFSAHFLPAHPSIPGDTA